MPILKHWLFLGFMTCHSSAIAQLVDFETLPDGSPLVDGMEITDQYDVSPFWVKFELVGASPGTDPRVSRVGPPSTAFQGPAVWNECQAESSDDDKPAVGEPVGCFFLSSDSAGEPYPLLVTYSQPVTQASGMLLDIEDLSSGGYEEWTISAIAEDSVTVLAQEVISAGQSGTGNGIASLWIFELQQEIHFIRFDFTGDLNGGSTGFAFDNFSPASVPADLQVVKSGPDGPLALGEVVSYDITVMNHGPGAALGVTLEDQIPDGFAFLSAVPSQGSCVEVGGIVTCDLLELPVGGMASVELQTRLDQIIVTNTVVVGSASPDLDFSNNVSVFPAEVDCETSSTDSSDHTVAKTSLQQNIPNPFGKETLISFVLAVEGLVEIEVYDAAGRSVRKLLREARVSGTHSAVWDGRNDVGRTMASGIYLYELRVDGVVVRTRQTVLLR